MLAYVIRRLLAMIPTLFLVSVLTFIIIQLPPGDFLTTLAIQAAESGGSIDESAMQSLRQQYGLDQPKYVQYLPWTAGFPRGDFGYSVEWKKPVGELIGSRLGFTLVLSGLALLAMWLPGVPHGGFFAHHPH